MFRFPTFDPSYSPRFFREGTPENYRELAQEIADNVEAAWVELEAAPAGAAGGG